MTSRPRYDIREDSGVTPVRRGDVIGIEGYTIAQWCDSLDGTGPASAVAVRLHMPPEFGIDLMLRLKSRHAVNTFIEIMERHRDEVWPLPKGREVRG